MDEIFRLQRELAEVQQTSATLKLSESNIIEIVTKLIQAGKVELIYTQNGKEYVTPAQLLSEIEDEILTHHGRVNLADLQPILNVDLSHIEHVTAKLLVNDPTVRLLNGQLITDWYLDSLAEQVNVALQQVGRLSISDLAVEYEFSMDFLTELISRQLGTSIIGQLSQGTLYTPAYVTRHAAQMRGALIALVQPTSLDDLIRRHKFNSALLQASVSELIESKQVAGSLQSGGFVPAIFEAVQNSAVDSFYAANGYVEYALLTKLSIPNPKKHLRARHPGGLELETCYAAPAVVEQLESLLDDCAASGSVMELSEALPAHLTFADGALVLAKCHGAYAKGGVRLIADELLVSKAVLDKATQLITEREELRAREAAAAGGLMPTAAAIGDSDDEAVIISTGLSKKGKAMPAESAAGKGGKRSGGTKGKKGKKGRGDSSDDDDDDENDADFEAMLPRAGGRASKKANGGNGGGTAAKGKGGNVQPAASRDGGERTDERKGLAGVLCDKLDVIATHADLIAGALMPVLEEARAKAAREVQQAGAGVSKKRQQELQEKVQSEGAKLQMLVRAATSLESDTAAALEPGESAAICKALLTERCTDAAALLIESELLHQRADFGKAALATDADSRRAALAKLYDGAHKIALAKLWAAATSKSHTAASLEVFLTAFREGCEACSMLYTPLDKKREKTLVSNTRAALRASIENEIDPALVVTQCIELLYCELSGVLVFASKDTARPLLKALVATSLPAGALATIRELLDKAQPSDATKSHSDVAVLIASVRAIALTKEGRSGGES